MQLRQGVAETFAKRHLRSVLNAEVLQTAGIKLREEARKYLAEFFKDPNWPKELTGLGRETIKERVSAAFDTDVNAAIDRLQDTLNKRLLETERRIGKEIARIVGMAEAKYEKKLDQLVDEDVNRRIAAIAKKIRESEKQ
jgi:hypothetical protein